jgi:uncharacterized protein YfiM (DUF2279 family)
MKSDCSAILLLLVILIFHIPNLNADENHDKWFSKDKYQHFTISAFYTLGSATILNRHFESSQGSAIAIGAGFTISLGLGKELADKRKPTETSSIKDLIWDAAGVLTGMALAGLLL